MSRWDAIRTAKAWLQRRPVYLDTETTGLGPDAEIVEIAIVDSDGTPLVNTLVRPQGEVPWEATQVHGLTAAHLRTAPTWPQVWPHVVRALSGRLVLIYNAEYDLRLMQQTNQRYGIPFEIPGAEFQCLMLLYGEFKGKPSPQGEGYKRWRLEQAGQALGIPLPNSHRALDDTLLARAVHLKLAAQPLPWG